MTLKLVNFHIMMILVGICLCGLSIASDDTTITNEDVQTIIEQLDNLSDRLDKLDKSKSKQPDSRLKKNVKVLKKDIDEMQDILDVVERKSIVDLVELGAELRTRFDWFSFDGHDNIPFTEIQKEPIAKEHVRLLPSNRLRLNLQASIRQSLRFHSRLVMYKNWADDDQPVYPDVNFLNETRIPTDIHVKVERAYVDYFFQPIEKIPMAFTFGRLPTTDGLPTDLRENTPRKSTYPSMAYNVEKDGLAFSVDLSKITRMPGSAFRLIYARIYDDNEKYRRWQLLSNKVGVYRVDEQAMEDVNIIISQFETMFPYPMRDTIFIASFVMIPDCSTPDMRFEEDLDIFYHNDTGMLYVDNPGKIGQGYKMTFFIESKEFMDFDIDWFAGVGYMRTKAEGALKFMFNPKVLGFQDEPILARDAYNKYKKNLSADMVVLLKQLENAPTPIGLLNDDGVSDRSGYSVQIGLRYNIPHPAFNYAKIGIEYNHSSRYWMAFADASEDPLNKLNVRGHAWDFYYIQPINQYMMFRIGHTITRHDYDQGLSFYYGQPLAIDHKIMNSYILMDAKF